MSGLFTQSFGLGQEFTADLTGTIQKLHDIGFDGIEPFVPFIAHQHGLPKNFWSFDTLKTAKEKMDELGMTIPSVHIGVSAGWLAMPVSMIAGKIRMLHEQFGICDFVLSGMFSTLAQARHWAAFLRRLSDAVRPYGCRVLYHNHDDEFCKVFHHGKNTEALEVFLELSGPDVMLQMDIGWAGIAGDEQAAVQRYADRIASLHLKDFYPAYRSGTYSRKNMPTDAFAAIGEGATATKEILAIRQTLPNFGGNVVIDQDKTTGDLLEAIAAGYRNVRPML